MASGQESGPTRRTANGPARNTPTTLRIETAQQSIHHGPPQASTTTRHAIRGRASLVDIGHRRTPAIHRIDTSNLAPSSPASSQHSSSPITPSSPSLQDMGDSNFLLTAHARGRSAQLSRSPDSRRVSVMEPLVEEEMDKLHDVASLPSMAEEIVSNSPVTDSAKQTWRSVEDRGQSTGGDNGDDNDKGGNGGDGDTESRSSESTIKASQHNPSNPAIDPAQLTRISEDLVRRLHEFRKNLSKIGAIRMLLSELVTWDRETFPKSNKFIPQQENLKEFYDKLAQSNSFREYQELFGEDEENSLLALAQEDAREAVAQLEIGPDERYRNWGRRFCEDQARKLLVERVPEGANFDRDNESDPNDDDW